MSVYHRAQTSAKHGNRSLDVCPSVFAGDPLNSSYYHVRKALRCSRQMNLVLRPF